MDSNLRSYAGAAAVILAGILLFGIPQESAATQCFQCEYWPINGTDVACLYPNDLSSSWAETVEVVECEHACFVSNQSIGTPDSIKITRGCYKDDYCPDMCMIDPMDWWESCTHCCDDDLCNDGLPEDAFDDSQWCFECGSYDADCVNPSPDTTLRTTCDTRCEMNVYISEQTAVTRGCALSEDDCNDCDDKDDCRFCCQGSYCNDAPPDVIVRKTNLTSDCFSCYYSPNVFEVADSSACGEDFDPNGVGVEMVQCSGVCKKVVAGSSIERSCVHNLEDCVAGCHWFGGPCTYCCTGNQCNAARKNATSNALLTLLMIFLALAWRGRHL